MRTFVALFRAINVGGRNVLPMKELVAILERIGLRNVKTYIQSGNVVFDSVDEAGPADLAERLGEAVAAKRGLRPSVIVLAADELESAVSSNPFPEAEASPGFLHLGFLAQQPGDPDTGTLDALRSGSERFAVRGKFFYLHAPEGIGRSRLAAGAERALGAPMTLRNWRTALRILDLAQQRYRSD